MNKVIYIRQLGLVVMLVATLALVPVQVDLVNMGIGWSQVNASEGHSGSHGGSHDSGDDHDHDDLGDDSHNSSKGGKKGHKSNRSPSDAVASDVLKGHGRSKRPVWAGGGIPNVELGRLNVSRAPSFVLDRALVEAEMALANDSAADIHSPLANLAMYREIVKTESLSDEQMQVAANYLGKAADKNTPISGDTIEAVNIILGTGFSLNNEQVTALALKADAIRMEILAAHGEDAAH
jgi:hypothetical protein